MSHRDLVGRVFALLAGLGAWLAPAPAAPAQPAVGSVYTMSNEADGNRLVRFKRNASGTLTPAGSLPTGGDGTGAGLGSQGSLIFAFDDLVLYGVNAGSGTISVFLNTLFGPALIQVVDAGGDTPISVTQRGLVVYVLNADGAAGGTDHINGFRVGAWGTLHPIANSTRPLSAASTAPAQVGFSPDGRSLVVTEKMTNLIDVYPVDQHGLAGQPTTNPSSGEEPFGFSFTRQGFLVVSEAFNGAPNASAVSSYRLLPDSTVDVVTPSEPTGQTAACWVARTQTTGFLYTSNTGSNSVSGFFAGANGSLTALTPGAPTATTGAGPIDADIVGNRFLYVLAEGSGQINSFRIGTAGALTPAQTVSGLPTSSVGLAAH